MGILVAIEGIDGSGKGTQARRLNERLVRSGIPAALVSFPRYDSTFFGQAVGAYLNGRFGSLDDVHPFLASLLFAGDRFESRSLLRGELAEKDIVVLDRYVASNVAHQAAKAAGSERDALRRSIEHVEYVVFELPKPDLIVLLDVSVARAQSLIAGKPTRTYTNRTADIQESDAAYLSRVRDLYLDMAQSDPLWSAVRCERDGAMRSVDEIADEIWGLVTAKRSQAH